MPLYRKHTFITMNPSGVRLFAPIALGGIVAITLPLREHITIVPAIVALALEGVLLLAGITVIQRRMDLTENPDSTPPLRRRSWLRGGVRDEIAVRTLDVPQPRFPAPDEVVGGMALRRVKEAFTMLNMLEVPASPTWLSDIALSVQGTDTASVAWRLYALWNLAMTPSPDKTVLAVRLTISEIALPRTLMRCGDTLRADFLRDSVSTIVIPPKASVVKTRQWVSVQVPCPKPVPHDPE